MPPALLDPWWPDFRPRRVILFGSRARGEAREDSDIDLLVVVDDDTPAERLTLDAGFEARLPFRLPADVIPCRGGDFAARAASSARWRTPRCTKASWSMSGPDTRGERRTRRLEAGRWLAVAEADRRAVRLCLAADPPEAGIAAYHCQQAAEKLIKALLVLADIPFGRVHDLARLGDLAAARYPALQSLLARIGRMTVWGYAYRYPALEDTAEPSPVALREAGEMSSSVWPIRRAPRSLAVLTVANAPRSADPHAGNAPCHPGTSRSKRCATGRRSAATSRPRSWRR